MKSRKIAQNRQLLQNHHGSSKSMEVNVAVQMFSDAVASDTSCSTYSMLVIKTAQMMVT